MRNIGDVSNVVGLVSADTASLLQIVEFGEQAIGDDMLFLGFHALLQGKFFLVLLMLVRNSNDRVIFITITDPCYLNGLIDQRQVNIITLNAGDYIGTLYGLSGNGLI